MIFLLTINHGDSVVYNMGAFATDQDRFNMGLEQLGIVDDEKKNIINRINKRITKVTDEENLKTWKLVNAQANSISNAEDLFQVLENYKKLRI